MKIVNEQLLDLFRTSGQCEICLAKCPAREPHHLFCRGMGGGSRLDVRINLVAVGRSGRFCQCHTEIHDGNLAVNSIFQVVSAREGFEIDDILDVMYLFRRLPKDPSERALRAAIQELRTERACELARRELREAGVLT